MEEAEGVGVNGRLLDKGADLWHCEAGLDK